MLKKMLKTLLTLLTLYITILTKSICFLRDCTCISYNRTENFVCYIQVHRSLSNRELNTILGVRLRQKEALVQ